MDSPPDPRCTFELGRPAPGKGAWPVVESTQLGSRIVAPVVPQAVHRLLVRKTSLLAPSPKWAITSPSLSGAL
jgi:hypothetical protein